MPMKDILYKLQPLQLYIVLALSIVYFLVQLFLSHITHALTLLVDSYHMLCNIIALSGCIITIKHSRQSKKLETKIQTIDKDNKDESKFTEICINSSNDVKTIDQSQQERSLKNTFGWTRIDVLTMLIVCIFLASLCFSLLVEAVQTLVHIDHQDAMHHPISVLITGGFGLLLNGLCYILIGGYTFHQGSFLHITSTGDVVLDRVLSGDSLKQGERRLSRTKKSSRPPKFQPSRRQNIIECIRDICSSVFVIICSIIVYFADDEQVSKFVDPLISIVSCILLLVLSYPYMKESCLILLQTIPDSINIDEFKKELMTTFSEIQNIHDLHIWQLTGHKYVSTAHIIFQNPSVYSRIMEDLIGFFKEQGINIVTIQPEFTCTNLSSERDCLVKCIGSACVEKHCCNNNIFESDKYKLIDHQKIENLEMIISTSDEIKQVDEPILEEEKSVKEPEEKELKTRSTTSLDLTPIKDEEDDSLIRSRIYVSESQLSVPKFRDVSELGPEFDQLNVEIMFNLDKVGCIDNSNDEININSTIKEIS